MPELSTTDLIAHFTNEAKVWASIIEKARLRHLSHTAADWSSWHHNLAVSRATLEKLNALYALEQIY